VTLLKNIVRIQTGVYLKPDRFGSAVYIQVKDFDVKGQLSQNLQPKNFINERLTNHFLQSGNILFAAKGDNNFAVVYNDEYPAAVAAPSSFVLKHSNRVLKEKIFNFR